MWEETPPYSKSEANRERAIIYIRRNPTFYIVSAKKEEIGVL